MRPKWLLLLSLALVIVALAGERFTSWRVAKVRARTAELKAKAVAAEQRQRGRQEESLHYQNVMKVAAEIALPPQGAQADPTVLLRWFSEAAAQSNVRLRSSKLAVTEGENLLVAGGAYYRIRFDLDLEGEYAPLVSYIDRIERSAQPMIVDSLALFADRSDAGIGKMRLMVSCLTPVAGKLNIEEKPAAQPQAPLPL